MKLFTEMILKLFFLVIFFSMNILSQDKPASEFNKIVTQYKQFFKSDHNVIIHESVYSDKVKESYYLVKYIPYRINYDAKPVESILTPYEGYIEIDYYLKTNLKCGDITLDGGANYGWSNPKAALNEHSDDKCFGYFNEVEDLYTDKFYFIYKDKKWTLASVKDKQKKTSRFSFLYNLGTGDNLPISDKEALKINNKWKVLIPNKSDN